MSKLLEQVKEIQARAHMCPECKGTGEVETHPYGWLMPCDECDGTGEVPAPDIDALVEFIEVLTEPWVVYMQKHEHMRDCWSCLRGNKCDVRFKHSAAYNVAEFKSKYLVKHGLSLVKDGLPGEEVDTRC